MRKLFAFPNPVNEVSARLVAAGVLVQSVVFVATGWRWLLVPLAYGFVARVLTGPTLSPLGQIVTRVVTPRLGLTTRLVPGPPKRFAQGVGTAFTVVAVVAAFGFDAVTLARGLVATVAVAALLESAFAYCVGCKVFAALMRVGVIPESVCAECNDLSVRIAAQIAVESEPRHLFVYGTLRPGEVRWPILAPFVVDDGHDDAVAGSLFDTGAGYPAALFGGEHRIHGRTYELIAGTIEPCLELLDEEEGAVDGLYHRVAVRSLGGTDVWAYQYGGGLTLTRIESGDWLQRG